MKILLIKPEHIGDFALALPALWEAHQRFGSDLFILTHHDNKGWKEVLPWLKNFNTVYNPKHDRSGNFFNLPAFLDTIHVLTSLRSQKFSIGIEMANSPNDKWSKLYLNIAGCKKKIGVKGHYDFLHEEKLEIQPAHQSLRNAQYFPKDWNITATTSPADFIPHEFRWQNRHSYILISPFAGNPQKEWSWENWKTVINEKLSSTYRVLLPPSHHHLVDYLGEKLHLHRDNFLFASSLKDTMHHVAKAQVVVAPDTSVAHICQLTGTPLVELFSSTADVNRWKSLATGVVLSKNKKDYSMNEITPAEVIQALKSLLS